MTIQLVATDLDNTFLNNQKQVSLRNKKALQYLKQKHIVFGLASGRDFQSVYDLLDSWGIQDMVRFIIGTNGGQVYDVKTNELIIQGKISGSLAYQIYKAYTDSKSCFFVRNGNDRYQDIYSSALHQDALKYNEPEHIVNIQDYLQNHDIDKASIFCEPEDMDSIKEIGKSLDHLPLSQMQSSQHLYEFMDKNTNKGTGLIKACQLLHIPLEKTMAFGDATNDYTLIEQAAVGIAMKNGTKDVKAIANYITKYTSDEDGFARFIENYFQ